MRKFFVFSVLVGVLLSMAACSSSGPPRIQPGSPAFFWGSARDAQVKGDFNAVIENLGNLTGSTNEYRERAEVWQMAVSMGLARGDMEWADALMEGGKMSRGQMSEFRRVASMARGVAAQNVMRFAELAHGAMLKGFPAEVELAFSLPTLESAKPPEMGKIAKGIFLQPADLNKTHNAMLDRGVVLTLTRMAGAGEDVDKARTLLASGSAKLKREEWLLSLAREFTGAADLFGPKKLNQDPRIKLMTDEALEALEKVPASEETKKLRKQIDDMRKKLPKTTT